MGKHGGFCQRRWLEALLAAAAAGGCCLPPNLGGFKVGPDGVPRGAAAHKSPRFHHPEPSVQLAEPPRDISPVSGHVYEQLSAMSQDLARAVDDHKLLAARLLQFQGQVEERDKEIAAATREFRGAIQEMTRTREDLQRQRIETDTLRKKLIATENELKKTYEEMIRILSEPLRPDSEPPP